MSGDPESDVSKALAAFGSPRLQYRSFATRPGPPPPRETVPGQGQPDGGAASEVFRLIGSAVPESADVAVSGSGRVRAHAPRPATAMPATPSPWPARGGVPPRRLTPAQPPRSAAAQAPAAPTRAAPAGPGIAPPHAATPAAPATLPFPPSAAREGWVGRPVAEPASGSAPPASPAPETASAAGRPPTPPLVAAAIAGAPPPAPSPRAGAAARLARG